MNFLELAGTMPIKLRINALIVFVLALLFAFFFDFTKHNPSIASINPFADDPYDAIGTFALQATVFLGILSLFRAFRPSRKIQPSEERELLLVRTQVAIVLCVTVALAGDMVAMTRHVSLWSVAPTSYMFILLIIGFSLFATVVGIRVLHSAKEVLLFSPPNSWKKPALLSVIFFIVLFFYPESIRESTLGALFTVIVGAILLFMPVWAWGEFLSPTIDTQSKTVMPRWTWGVIGLIGIVLGFTIVLRELSEGGAMIDVAGSIFIISIYIGLEVAGFVIGYAFLGKFLGIFQIQGQSVE